MRNNRFTIKQCHHSCKQFHEWESDSHIEIVETIHGPNGEVLIREGWRCKHCDDIRYEFTFIPDPRLEAYRRNALSQQLMEEHERDYYERQPAELW